MNILEQGDISWDEHPEDNEVINLEFFRSFAISVRKEDFDGIIKNLQDIHKEFLFEDGKKSVKGK